jgi:catechol 2,3-dioxygenase-like lactoylglutathione lyase family enzyme
MSRAIPGLHHVTAIAGPPQANVDFYVGTMRQRLVKRPSTSTRRTPTTCTTATGRARPAPS